MQNNVIDEQNDPNQHDMIKYSKIKQIKTSNMYKFNKRFGDILFVLILLPAALVLIVIFATLIKLESPGTPFFVQERVGRNGKHFKLYKLRSMGIDAEKNGAQWAKRNDPRVTRIGAFIRKTRIDELPQLFNVLKGEMSIIGPRPERPLFTFEFEQKYPGFIQRLAVKPGLTGWAQVNGGYEITPKQKAKLDMYYIKNQCFKLDMRILYKTIKVVLTGDGAR